MTAVRWFQPLPDLPLDVATLRGRTDPAFFSHYFLARRLHDKQAEFVCNANASVNILATANRFGKTTLEFVRHAHKCFYKADAEPRYIFDGVYDHAAYLSCEFKTVHTAGMWDTAKLVWLDGLKIIRESKRIQPFIRETPKTLPPHIGWENGAQTLFRTLGDNAEGIDGHSFHHVSIDEAGWITNLKTLMDNVARIRTADVRGTIDIIGTFKPGISKDFYGYARRASVYTGTKIGFDHRDGSNYYEQFGLADLEREVADAEA